MAEEEPILAICKDRAGTLFIGTQTQGLWTCESDLKPAYLLGTDTQPALADNCVTSIFEDSNGQVWIGSQTQGIHRWDRRSNRLENYTRQNSGLTDNNIRCFAEYNGGLLVGTFDGLSMLNLFDNTLSRHHIFDMNRSSLSHFSVYSIHVDRVGTLWVGTYAGGVNYYNPLNNRFVFYHPQGNPVHEIYGVFGTMLFHDDALWMATEGGGLFRFDPRTRSYTNYLPDEQRGSHHNRNIIKSLMREGDYIWCGTNYGAIYHFHVPTRRFTLYHQFDREKNMGIYTMHRDREGALWVGTTSGRGLWKFSADGKKTDRFPVGGDSVFVNFPGIRSFLELRQDVYLIGTRAYGLYQYDAARQTLIRYNTTEQEESRRLESNYITSILRKEDGEIWIGTFGGGVCLFDETGGICRKVDVSAGLPNNHVYALVEYDGNLWISLDKGITELRTATGEIRNYDSLNGLEALEFTPKGGICLPDGEIYFSGSNGFLSFRPGELVENTWLPPVVLTGLTVNNLSVTPGDSTGLLTHVLDDTDELVLTYDRNNFSIAYCAMNYIYHFQNRYAYQLEGHEFGWNQVGTRKEAYYTNIAPGKYTFRVIASNNDGYWNETGKSLRITILPPWWKTPWAYLAYLLLFLTVTGTIGYYIYTKKKLEHNLRMRQLERQRLEEFHQTKVRLFTNFSHELRTPLTLVISPLEELLQQIDLSASIREKLRLVLRNSRRLFLLVNQLMDLQKNQSGHLKLELSETDMNAFLKEIYFAFRQIAEGRRIEFRYEAPEEEVPGCFDFDLLEKAVFNLLSNAFKFTVAGESVTLSLAVLSGEKVKKEYSSLLTEEAYDVGEGSSYVVIRVADTGKGIPEEERKHVFAPFYQITDLRKAADNTHGTGIGLSLTQSVVKLHRGMVGVSSHQPKGTVFTVIIPNDRTAYPEEEFTTGESRAVTATTSAPTVEVVPGKTILLVEDNPDIRTYIRQHLEPHYKVLEAAEGAGAFEKVLQEYPDLVVTDIMMPGVDGLELCGRLKEDLRTSHIPIILLTARTLVMHIKEGYRTGADDYMVKPFHMDVLLIRIHNLLAQREKLKAAYGKNFSLESLGIETTSADEKFMQKLFVVIGKHLSNPDLRVELICEEMGFSRTNFYRKIKAITDLSPNDLIRTKRLEIAARMLCETDKNVSEVSMATGFSTLAYFTKCFKAMYGMTPTEYIKTRNGMNLQTSGTQE
ncbi:MAG: response regulator [Bacteroides sp.]|nr:response regulator [Bacteroides sp.]